MPVPSNHHTDPQISNDTEIKHTNTDNQFIKDDIANVPYRSNNTNDISKIGTSGRPNVEVLRANSPTLKRLIAVRIELHKYTNSIPDIISTSRQSIQTVCKTTNCDNQSTTNVRPSSQKQIKSKRNPYRVPLDKITYQTTSTHNGNFKQKCSLEIWLPNAASDENDGNTNEATTPDPHIIEKKSQSPQLIAIKSGRSSTIKITATSRTNLVRKSFDVTYSKTFEPVVIPRVYHYEDYLTDQHEERPRSSKSVNTPKSEGNGSHKNVKRQRTHTRRLSTSTNYTEETDQSATTRIPMTSKHLLPNIKQPYRCEIKGTLRPNTLMINELIKKYSMIKRSHQDLIQAKLQLEKLNHDSKSNVHITKDHSLSINSISDSTSYTSDHPTVSNKKLLNDTLLPRSAEDCNTTNIKSFDRRLSHRKPLYSDIFSQARLFSLVNHLHHRQTTVCMPATFLPAIGGKKNYDLFRFEQHSRTLGDNSEKIPSRLPVLPDSSESAPNSSNLLQRITNRIEQTSSRISKRSLPPSLLTLRSKQQQIAQPVIKLVQYQNVQNSAQRYHHSTDTTTSASTNKTLVHLKYSNAGNIDRDCLVPE